MSPAASPFAQALPEPASFANEPIERLVVNTIKTLTIDAVEKAKSGHPGLPMGCADFAFVLWTEFLKFNPANPQWRNRDRFVLSAGHGSMLLYSLLHLSGIKEVTLEQLQNFRQYDSATPGHPESFMTPGVEVTTGPLGQGCGNSVGLAIAQKFFAATFNTPELSLCDHRVYAIVSDGDLEEGISHEAASLAGHLGLGNLVWFYDDNSVTIEGKTSLAYSDNAATRFRGYQWHVIEIDGHDHAQIATALKEAAATSDRPTLIVGKTVIGAGSPKLQGTSKAHSDAFGAEEVAATKRNLGWPEGAQFLVPQRVKEFFAEKRKVWAALEKEWNEVSQRYASAVPDKAKTWEACWNKALPNEAEWKKLLPEFPAGKAVATRSAGGEVLEKLFAAIPSLLGGSADLAPSTKTWIKAFGSFEKTNYAGRNLHFGVREHAMAAACAGMAYYGGLIPFGATFFVFTDYLRPSLRLAALSHLQAIFVMTHDSIFVGEDGPTHEPIEHLASLRAMPGLCVLRPADANETAQAWRLALENKKRPTVLCLTRQNVPTFDRTVCASVEGVRRGGYVLWESAPGKTPELIFIGTGSEASLCLEAAQALAKENPKRALRVVSLPSWDIFSAQDQKYRDEVLPPVVTKRLAVEAGATFGWERWVGSSGRVIGMERFGASAPYEVLAEKFGFTVGNVQRVAQQLLGG